MKLIAKNSNYQEVLDTHKNIKEIDYDEQGPVYYKCLDCGIKLYYSVFYKSVSMAYYYKNITKHFDIESAILSCGEYIMVNIL